MRQKLLFQSSLPKSNQELLLRVNLFTSVVELNPNMILSLTSLGIKMSKNWLLVQDLGSLKNLDMLLWTSSTPIQRMKVRGFEKN